MRRAGCKRPAEDPEKFWAEIAKELHWHEPWTKVFDWKYPTFEWFIGGRRNITYNCARLRRRPLQRQE